MAASDLVAVAGARTKEILWSALCYSPALSQPARPGLALCKSPERRPARSVSGVRNGGRTGTCRIVIGWSGR
jgi:hypothetical protein